MQFPTSTVKNTKSSPSPEKSTQEDSILQLFLQEWKENRFEWEAQLEVAAGLREGNKPQPQTMSGEWKVRVHYRIQRGNKQKIREINKGHLQSQRKNQIWNFAVFYSNFYACKFIRKKVFLKFKSVCKNSFICSSSLLTVCYENFLILLNIY